MSFHVTLTRVSFSSSSSPLSTIGVFSPSVLGRLVMILLANFVKFFQRQMKVKFWNFYQPVASTCSMHFAPPYQFAIADSVRFFGAGWHLKCVIDFQFCLFKIWKTHIFLFIRLRLHSAGAGIEHRMQLMNIEIHFIWFIFLWIWFFSVFFILWIFIGNYELCARCMLMTQYAHRTICACCHDDVRSWRLHGHSMKKILKFKYLACCCSEWDQIFFVSLDAWWRCLEKIENHIGRRISSLILSPMLSSYAKSDCSVSLPANWIWRSAKFNYAGASGALEGKQKF